jgi:predicted nuclease of predicted toxin-antitoxin system
MNFVADESVDQPIVDHLRKGGHHILAVMEASPGLTDDEVLRMANSNAMLLLTADKDFGELVFRGRLIAHGVVLIRLAGLSAHSKGIIVSSAIARPTPSSGRVSP